LGAAGAARTARPTGLRRLVGGGTEVLRSVCGGTEVLRSVCGGTEVLRSVCGGTEVLRSAWLRTAASRGVPRAAGLGMMNAGFLLVGASTALG
jgi:hypothetical protein